MSRKPKTIYPLTQSQQKMVQQIEEFVDTEEPIPFTSQKCITYFFSIVFPPYGIYRLWKKENGFNTTEKTLQTLMIIVYIVMLTAAIFQF